MAKKKKNPKLHVKTGDRVQVITGRDKGVVSEIIKAFPKENKVLVRDVNIVTKHQKPTQANQQGGIIQKEAKLDVSNVLLYCDHCGKGVRTKKQFTEDGKKVRVCTTCNTNLDQI